MSSGHRIGIDARLYYQTGVGRYIRCLLSELASLDKKNDYVIFVTKKDKDLITLPVKNFHCILADFRWHSLAEQVIFPRLLLEHDLDLVHFPYFSLPIFYPKPFVVTIHDLTPKTHATGKASALPLPMYSLKRFGYNLVLSQAVNRSCRILVPSLATKTILLSHYPQVQSKISVTYEGVTVTQGENKKPLVEGEYFLYVGNAYPHKNIDRLVEAFGKVDGNSKLVLVGEQDYFYKKLKERLGLLKEKQIIFFGAANDKELANLYRHALALVFPSLSEGFGLPALEAMAYNCLVIASSIPSLKEICADTAVYIDPRSEESIYLAMQKVYKDRFAFESYKKKAVERLKIFSWRKMAKETLSVYERCTSV